MLHHCDTPTCCNPDHLFLGTIADNNRDRARKGRSCRGDQHWQRKHPERRMTGDKNWTRKYPERVLRGESSPRSKLTEARVRSIREMYSDGFSQDEIARHFGVGQSTVSAVLRGDTWAHVR